MKLRNLLIAGAVLTIIVLAGSTVFGYLLAREARDSYGRVVTEDAEHLIALSNAQAAVSITTREALSIATISLAGDSAEAAEELAVEAGELAEAREAFDEAMEAYERTEASEREDEEGLFEVAIRERADRVFSAAESLVALTLAGAEGEQILDVIEEIEVAENEFEALIAAEIERDRVELAERAEAANRSALYAIANTVGAGIVALALTIAVAVLGSRSDRLQAEYNAALTERNLKLQSTNEQLVIAEREAREATRMKDEFLSVMSHELRTPLNAILGYQGLMEMMGDLDEENLGMVQRTQANARRLLGLINDVLDISRIEAGRMELTPSALPVGRLLREILTQMQVLADEKKLPISAEIDRSVPDVIYYDEDAIQKILTNLLSNAIKFTEKGQVTLKMRVAANRLLISVSDTGRGIPRHMHEVIFERFRQVDSTTTREHGGSGLGLSIVQQMAQMMGGRVSVQSEPGEGSTFTVDLPLQAAPLKMEPAR